MTHDSGMTEGVRRALAAAAGLSRQEREELVTRLILELEGDADADEGYDEAWATEIRRRVDAVLSGKSKGRPWKQVRAEIEAELARRRSA